MYVRQKTQYSFNEEEWKKLSELARLTDNKASQLVRLAVRKTFFPDEVKTMRRIAVDSILKIRQIFKKLNYKALINYGRKI